MVGRMSSTRVGAAVIELIEALREEIREEMQSAAMPVGPQPDRLLSVAEAAECLGISRSSTYTEIQSGRLRTIKVGRRRLVPQRSLHVYVMETGR